MKGSRQQKESPSFLPLKFSEGPELGWNVFQTEFSPTSKDCQSNEWQYSIAAYLFFVTGRPGNNISATNFLFASECEWRKLGWWMLKTDHCFCKQFFRI